LTKDLVPIVFHDDFAAILEEKVGSCPSRDVEDRNHVTPVFFIKKTLYHTRNSNKPTCAHE